MTDNDYGLDWNAIAEHIGPDPLLTPSQGEEARLRLKEAFAEGRMVAGSTGMTERERSRVGCALGQSPMLRRLGTSTKYLVATINNFTCLGLTVPDRYFVDGVPLYGTNRNIGQPLTTIDPLLRLIDLFVEGGR